MKCTFTSHLLRCISLLCVTLFIFNGTIRAQENQWTWMSGSDAHYQGNTYGTKGVSAPGNVPGGRWAGRSWTDDKGNLWLFGGHEGQQDLNTGFRNDLWRYTISNNQWAWISGDNVIDQSAVYGVKGVANVNNKPGARAAGESWNDKHGNLWLFGGGGYVSNIHGWQNDLWKYSIATNEWTWMSGDTVLNAVAVYGTKGVASATNMPGSRVSGVSWTDEHGDFWIFGGLGYASSHELGALNDLWKYSLSKNEWTWMGGDSLVNTTGVYGTKGTPSASNKSGGREASSGWTDKDGNFWLFGGYGYSSVTNIGWMNDLWKYEPASNEWTWMSGDNIPNQAGVYGFIGVPGSANNPGARSSATTMVGKKGELWIFSGYVVSDVESGRMNDLWKYDPSTNMWTWMSGEMSSWASGVYGVKGQPDADNTPGARDEPSSWTDKGGDLWVFGGRYSYDAYGVFNDLWRYQPGTRRYGICCFTGKDGALAACGPNVNAVNCMGSGSNAFFVGYVSDCAVLDPALLCSLTTSEMSLMAQYVEENNSARLTWQLPTGHETKGFYVQRSRDGSTYKSIAFIPFNISGIYEFADVNPLAEGYYKVVWFENQGFETNKVLVAIPMESGRLQLVPNPAADKVRIVLNDIQLYDTQVSVYNNSGIQVLTQLLSKGKNREIDVSILKPGLYYIRVEMNQQRYHERLLKE